MGWEWGRGSGGGGGGMGGGKGGGGGGGVGVVEEIMISKEGSLCLPFYHFFSFFLYI